MYQVQTRKYEIGTLKPMNGNHDHEHTLNQQDVLEVYNSLIKFSEMEIIRIEKRVWESLKQYVSLLTSEVEAMKAQFLPKLAEA